MKTKAELQARINELESVLDALYVMPLPREAHNMCGKALGCVTEKPFDLKEFADVPNAERDLIFKVIEMVGKFESRDGRTAYRIACHDILIELRALLTSLDSDSANS